MIGIEKVASYIPENYINANVFKSQFGVDNEFLEKKTGMLHLARKNRDDDTSDLCCKAFRRLVEEANIEPSEIECIVVCTQNPDGYGLPHTSAIVHGKLGLPSDCAVFDISLGCSGYVYGLSVISSFMETNGMRKGVLITADPYSKIINENDKNTMLLFGDAATATLMSENPIWKLGRYVFGTSGSESSAIQTKKTDRLLDMNGRSVFTFSASVVPNNIKKMLMKNNLSIDDVDKVILHQGSKFVVDTIRKRLNLDSEKVPFSAGQYGNTVSSSIPLLLKDVDQSTNIVVIAGFGVGLSWASTVLKRH